MKFPLSPLSEMKVKIQTCKVSDKPLFKFPNRKNVDIYLLTNFCWALLCARHYSRMSVSFRGFASYAKIWRQTERKHGAIKELQGWVNREKGLGWVWEIIQYYLNCSKKRGQSEQSKEMTSLKRTYPKKQEEEKTFL